MKEIKIANSTLKFTIDDEDFERVLLQTWYLEWSNGKPIRIFNPEFKLSRFLLNYTGDKEIDHKDRNIFNNRKNNLREADKQQQAANRDKLSGFYSSNYKGVFWYKRRKSWVAAVSFRSPGSKKRVKFQLGYFQKEEDAARAYNKKALELFGEFACLNKIEGEEN